MRFALLAAAFALLPSSALAQPASAQAMYVERRGLLEADAQCDLFAPEMRAALQAGAGQARGALLRGGWTQDRVAELERAAINAARARACGDARTSAAAERARAGFVPWTRAASMSFPGAERTWVARRIPDSTRWRLTQSITSPISALFGVRDDVEGGQHLTLVLPLAAGVVAPASAQMQMRDPARANANILDLRGRTIVGLEAGAPAPANAVRFFASARHVERLEDGRRQAVLQFPVTAFEAMFALDPRETIAIELETGGRRQRLLVEVGDIAAARSFLVIGARS